LYIKPWNFAKRQRKLQWVTPPIEGSDLNCIAALAPVFKSDIN
jgi:hypothetical protein